MINLDTRVLDLVNENELWLIVHVAKRMQVNRMTAWPSIKTLCSDTRWNENTLRKWRKSLCDKGFLSIEQRQAQTPIYRFTLKGIGVFNSLSGEYQEEIPLPKISTPPSQKLVPELVNNGIELTSERGNTPAPAPTPANGGVSFYLEKKEKISLDIPPARAENFAAAPRWQEIPRADTPRELENYLTGFYSQHPHELTYICERTQFQNNTSGVPAAIADFCTWAVGEGWNRRTLQQINARLGRWLRDEKRFSTNTTARGAQPVNAPTVVAPQTQIRYAK